MSYNANGLLNNDGTITQYGNTASRGGGSGNGIVEQSLAITKIGSFSLPTSESESTSDIVPFVLDDTLYLYFTSGNHGGFNAGDLYKLNEDTYEWDFYLNQVKSGLTTDNLINFNGLIYVLTESYYFTFDGETFSENINYPNGVKKGSSFYDFPSFAVLDDKIIFVEKNSKGYDSRFVTYSLDTEGNVELFCVYDDKMTSWGNTCLISLGDVLYAKNAKISLVYDKENNKWWQANTSSITIFNYLAAGYKIIEYKDKIVTFNSSSTVTSASTSIGLYVNGNYSNFATIGYNTHSSKFVVYKDKIWIIGHGAVPYNRILTYSGDKAFKENDISSIWYKRGNRKELVFGQSDGVTSVDGLNRTFMANDDLYCYKRLNDSDYALYKYDFTQKKFEVVLDYVPKKYTRCTKPIGDKLYGLGDFTDDGASISDRNIYEYGILFYSLDITTGEYEQLTAKTTSSGYATAKNIQSFWFNNYIYIVCSIGTFRYGGGTDLVYVTGKPSNYTYTSSGSYAYPQFNTYYNVVHGNYIYFVCSLIDPSSYPNYVRAYWYFNGSSWGRTVLTNQGWTYYYMALFLYNNKVYISLSYSTTVDYSGDLLYSVSASSYTSETISSVPTRLLMLARGRYPYSSGTLTFESNDFKWYYSSSKSGTFLCRNMIVNQNNYWGSSNYTIYAYDTASRVEFFGDDDTQGYSIGSPSFGYASPSTRRDNDIINYHNKKYWVNSNCDLYLYNPTYDLWEYKNTAEQGATASYSQSLSGLVFNDTLYIITPLKLIKYDEDNNTFESVALPYALSGAVNTVIYNDKLHIISLTSNYSSNRHFVYDGSNITDKSTGLQNSLLQYSAGGYLVFVDNNRINLLGISYSQTYQQETSPYVYFYFDTSWHQGAEPTCFENSTINLAMNSFFRYNNDMYCILSHYYNVSYNYRKSVYLGKLTFSNNTYNISSAETLIDQGYVRTSNQYETDAMLDIDGDKVIWYLFGDFMEYLDKPSSGSSPYLTKFARYPAFDPVQLAPLGKIEKNSDEPIGTNIGMSVQSKEIYTTKINLSEGKLVRGTSIYTVEGDATLQEDGTYLVNSTGDVSITSGSPITII